MDVVSATVSNKEIMRPLWTGSIGFGLVNIPVRLYTATAESNLSFV
jgi:DNA end-binding protein Ku